MQPSNNHRHLVFIDGLRGVAILLVMVNHWAQFLWASSPEKGRLFETLRGGHFGVSLFFLLSAYTLFSSSFTRFQTEASPYRNFYIRRAFRILPLWWLATTFYALARHHSPFDHGAHYFMYYMFRNAPFLFGGEWSLFVEESFYLFLPLVFSLAITLPGALVLLALTAGFRLVGQAHGLSALMPLAHWYAFALGVILFHAHRRWNLERTNGSSLPGLFALGAFFLTAPNDWGRGDVYATLALFALFLATVDPLSFLGKVARLGFLGKFGKSCYSLYLFHIAIAEWVCLPLHHWLSAHTAWAKLAPGWQFLVSFPVFALLALGFGLLCFRFVERPTIRWGQRLIQLLDQKTAVATS